MEKLNSLKQSYKDALIGQRKIKSEVLWVMPYSIPTLILGTFLMWALEELNIMSNSFYLIVATTVGWALIWVGLVVYEYYKTNLVEMFYKLVKSIHASFPQAPETPESEPSEE